MLNKHLWGNCVCDFLNENFEKTGKMLASGEVLS
jgi:hypothetical protein